MTDNDIVILQEKIKVLEKLASGQKKSVKDLNSALETVKSSGEAEIE
jgi:hypothetical protein